MKTLKTTSKGILMEIPTPPFDSMSFVWVGEYFDEPFWFSHVYWTFVGLCESGVDEPLHNTFQQAHA